MPSPPDRSRAIEAIERFIRESARSLTFDYDEAAGRAVMVVRDAATGEMVRQIPAEEVLAVARRLAKSAGAAGLIDSRG